MNRFLLQDLAASRPALRQAWLDRLPAGGPRPEAPAQVDAALHELFAALRHEAPEAGRAGPPARGSKCPEKGVMDFYLAGERALLQVALGLERADPAAAGAETGVELTELYSHLRRMARGDLTALCRRCAHCRKLGHGHPAPSIGLAPAPLNLAPSA